MLGIKPSTFLVRLTTTPPYFLCSMFSSGLWSHHVIKQFFVEFDIFVEFDLVKNMLGGQKSRRAVNHCKISSCISVDEEAFRGSRTFPLSET